MMPRGIRPSTIARAAEVLVLREQSGMSRKAIAAHFGISLRNVGELLRIARDRRDAAQSTKASARMEEAPSSEGVVPSC